jgi:DNA damage-binding protein 1
LGNTTPATSVSYLNNGYCYLGSHFGDSQLIRLDNFEIIETFPSLSPITDFCIVDLEKQPQIVACTGAYESGGLSVISNGIGVEEFKSQVFEKGLVGVFSLKTCCEDVFDSFLIYSFCGYSEIHQITDSGIYLLQDHKGLSLDETINAMTVVGYPSDHNIQVLFILIRLR